MDADAIIIGGGACGLMCAVQAGYLGKKVILLEKNEKVGAKILISGGGRCNYTNLHTTEEHFISNNPHFIKSALAQWTVDDSVNFFEMNGINGAEKTLGQLFPEGKNAKDVVQVFLSLCTDFNQNIMCDANVIDIHIKPAGFEVVFDKAGKTKKITASSLVIATGGLPIPKMGATDFALRFARELGLSIVETAPALVPLTITGKEEEWFASLSGNSIFCEVSNDQMTFEENILFTHWGLSGPAILQLSSYWRRGEEINLNLLPHQNIAELLEKERGLNGKIQLATFLNRFYAKRVTDAFAKFLPLDKPIASLSKEELATVAKTIHHFKVKPAGDKGYQKAEVMRGGIDTKEINSKTLMCKKIPNLFFGGECIDVTGWLGGYNFQWAWASGFVIAQNL